MHLFIDLPPDRVDVNVHPTKAEVRFLEQSLMHELLRRALGEALGQPTSAPMPVRVPQSASRQPSARSIPGVVSGTEAASRWSGVTDVFRRTESSTGSASTAGLASVVRDGAEVGVPRPEGGGVGPPLIPLGQFRDTFIVAVDNDGVAIIDQHVAHERVLYEQVMHRLTDGPLEGQRLLEPILLELPPGQREALAAHGADLVRFGFEVEAFGGDSVRITTVPGLLARTAAERGRARVGPPTSMGSTPERGSTIYCGASRPRRRAMRRWKANDRLTQEKMLYILAELRRTDYSTVWSARPAPLFSD